MARKMSKRTSRSEKLGLTADCTALYIRVSTDKQADEGYSLEAQQERLIAYCTAQQWPICQDHIYVDAGESAKSTSRPAYQRMVAAVEAGEVNRILVTKLDRLSRNTVDFLNFNARCMNLGVGIASIAEGFDTSTPVGEMVVTVLMGFATMERKQITDRVMTGKRQKATVGGFNGAPAPYGYTYTNGEFVIDHDRATVIERIFAEFVNGATMADIAQRLNDDGTPTARGGTWASATIRAMLRNGAYAGLSQWDGVESESATYPAIVDHDTYTAADRRLRALKPGKPAKVS